MAGSFKKGGVNKYIMMNRKTLAGVGSLVVLGASAVLAQGTMTLGDVRNAIAQNPSAWYVVVGSNASASDVIGAADIIAALQYYTVHQSVQPIDLSGVQVVLQSPIINETNLLSSSFSSEIENNTVVVNGTPIYYSVSLNVPKLNVSLNGSNTLQVTNAEFNLTLNFNTSISNLNNTQIPILGKNFYLTMNSTEIDLMQVPIQKYQIYLNQQVNVLGHTVSLVNIYQTTGQGYTAVLSVDGQEVEIPVGHSATVNGLSISVIEGEVSLINPENSYVEIGVSGGETYRLIQTSGNNYNITDPSGNVIGTATLSSDQQTLTLTFTKNYLFAGQSYELPIFGGYQIVFQPYSLPPANSDPVAVTYAGQQTISGSTYNVFNIQFTDPVTGKQVTLPIYYNASASTPQWGIGAASATSINMLVYDSSVSSSYTVGSGTTTYVLLTDNSSVSRLLKIAVNSQGTFAQITDLLNGEQYQLYLIQENPQYNPSVEIPLGSNNVNVSLVSTGYETYNLVIYNVTPVNSSSAYNFYTSDGNEISISAPSSTSTLSVTVKGYTFTLNGAGQDLENLPKYQTIVQEGSALYGAIFDSANDYIIYPLGVNYTGINFYLATSSTPSPSVELQDLLHATTQSYTVGVGGSVQIGNETVTVASLTGVPNQTETVQVGSPLIGYAVLDTEVTPDMNNLIVVGGPAVNRLAAELLGVPYPTYGDTLEQKGILSPGEGVIEVFTAPKTAVLVMGWEAEDTRAAARVLALFLTGQGYPQIANETEVKVTGGLQNTQVS